MTPVTTGDKSRKGQMRKPRTINLMLKPDAKESNLKPLGGGNADEWNRRLNDLTINALPIAHSKNKEAITTAAVAVCRGTMDIAPADPVEGILIAQLMAANEASLAMYSKAWAQPPEYFRGPNEIPAACRQGGTDGHDVDRKARPPPRPRPTADHGQARDHEQRHGRSGDNCR